MATSNSTKSSIDEAVARAPTGPGCYLWKDASGEILYVGKAVNLRSRLRNYRNPEEIKTRLLMERAADLEWIATETENEALLLEANLIKKHKPRYNVRLKDDKRYPYICVTTSETYPRIYITRTIREDGNRYFGPYSDVGATRQMVELIHRIFPIRSKRQRLPLPAPKPPCMNYHIKRCLGPCQGNVPEEVYRRIVDEIMLFLEGRSEILENVVISRMNDYSGRMEYEMAAIYRDMLANIRKATERQSVMSPGGGDEDVIAMAREGDNGQIVLLEIRGGRLLDRKSFPLVGVEHSQEAEILESFLRDYYLGASVVPPRITLPLRVKESGSLQTYLSEKFQREIKISLPGAPTVRSLLRMAGGNASLLLKERLLATKLRDKQTALDEIQAMFRLTHPPRVMECYDISHFQGEEPVASGVQFVEGEANPSGYRRYRIRHVEGINDPAMIQEVVARRLQRLLNEKRELPDLMVIDGGFTQLSAACEAAQSLGAGQLPMVGLAKKREEIYFPGETIPFTFDPNSAGMRLLRALRDEAHRFGITFHRERRDKRTLRHVLDSIPDVGPERRKAILRHMNGRPVLDASQRDFEEVSGIGPVLAEKIWKGLHSGEKVAVDAARKEV